MFGYEFIGFQALSDMLSNEPLLLWLDRHSVLLLLIYIIGSSIAKMTPSDKDDTFWDGLKERWEKYKG